jgi:hypothetical protein
MPKRTNVYFIQVERPDGRGPIKIGKADSPMCRLGELQVGNPEQLSLLAVIEDVPEALESYYHDLFGYCWIRGEWFAATDELLGIVSEVAQGNPDPDPDPLSAKDIDAPSPEPSHELLEWESASYLLRHLYGPVKPLSDAERERWKEVDRQIAAKSAKEKWKKRNRK